MIGYLITGHNNFAPGLKSSLEMIAGDQEKIETVIFQDNMSLEKYEDALKIAIQDLNKDGDGVVVFTDLLGGTPFRVAMMVASEFKKTEVITGTNLPMILEGISLRFSNNDIQSLVNDLLTTGVQSIQNPDVKMLEESNHLEDSTGEGI